MCVHSSFRCVSRLSIFFFVVFKWILLHENDESQSIQLKSIIKMFILCSKFERWRLPQEILFYHAFNLYGFLLSTYHTLNQVCKHIGFFFAHLNCTQTHTPDLIRKCGPIQNCLLGIHQSTFLLLLFCFVSCFSLRRFALTKNKWQHIWINSIDLGRLFFPDSIRKT